MTAPDGQQMMLQLAYFDRTGLGAADVAALREAFSGWPRPAGARRR